MQIGTGLPSWHAQGGAVRCRLLGLTARRFLDLGRTESMMCSPVAY